ncbi:MAG: hypothetical protein JW867_05140 [Candidatus Omnitrophica bacterium]|nr:hypothetical protein [Candidatus Omnitrophota bacterium]
MYKKIIRKIIWKVIGSDPRLEENIDLTTSRRRAMDYAISLIEHHTRVSRKNHKPGQEGSLLGDYLEFGCYQGASFIYAYKRAAKLMPWMKFYAFD